MSVCMCFYSWTASERISGSAGRGVASGDNGTVRVGVLEGLIFISLEG